MLLLLLRLIVLEHSISSELTFETRAGCNCLRYELVVAAQQL